MHGGDILERVAPPAIGGNVLPATRAISRDGLEHEIWRVIFRRRRLLRAIRANAAEEPHATQDDFCAMFNRPTPPDGMATTDYERLILDACHPIAHLYACWRAYGDPQADFRDTSTCPPLIRARFAEVARPGAPQD